MDRKNFLEKAYTELNDNIKFSEAKNAALITLNTALVGASCAIVFNSDISILWRIFIIFLAISLMIPLGISLYSFVAKMHHKTDTDDNVKFMYFSSIYKMYYNKEDKSYYQDLKDEFDDDFAEKQLSKQIVDLSAVAYKKFKAFNIAVIIEISIFMICSVFAFIMAICKLNGVL